MLHCLDYLVNCKNIKGSLKVGGKYLKKYLDNFSNEKCSTGSEVIKLFPVSTQLSMKFLMLVSIKYREIKHFSGSVKPRILFFMLIKVEMPTIVGISTFMSRKNSMLS